MSLAKRAYDEYADYQSEEKQRRDAQIGRVAKGALAAAGLAAAGYGLYRAGKHLGVRQGVESTAGHMYEQGMQHGVDLGKERMRKEMEDAAAAAAKKHTSERLRAYFPTAVRAKEFVTKDIPEGLDAAARTHVGDVPGILFDKAKTMLGKKSEISALEFMKTAGVPLDESIDFGFMQFSPRGRGPVLDAPMSATGESVDEKSRKTWLLHPMAIGTKALP